MSQEQSINDILQMLKHSVEDNAIAQSESDHMSATQQILSDEELKQHLKQQYETENKQPDEFIEQSYRIDPSLLELEEDSEKEEILEMIENSSVSSNYATNDASEQLTDQTRESSVEIEQEIFQEEIKESKETESDFLDQLFEIPQIETMSSAEDLMALSEEVTSSAFVQESEEKDLLEDTLVLNEIPFRHDELDQLPFFEELSEETPVFPEIKTIELNEILYDEQSEESTVQTNSEEILTEIFEDECEPAMSDTEIMQESVLELMSQLGCEDEIERLQKESAEDESMAEAVSVNRAERGERIQQLRELYKIKKARKQKLLLGTLLISILIFFYDTLPMFGVEFFGIVSHLQYSGAYILFGFQLVLICALFLGRSLLDGAKKLFTVRPNVYSMITLLLSFTFLYDMTMVFVADAKFPPMFHFLNAFMILTTVVGEYALTLREIKIFSIYTSDEDTYQYTLNKNDGEQSIAEQMYAGGFDRNKNIYISVPVQDVTEKISSDSESEMENKWIQFALFPIAFLSVLTMIVAILLQNSIEIAAISAMVMLFSMLPLHIVFTICLPLLASTHFLKKRGIAITGKTGMDVYASGDLLVYNDLHLFRPCTAKDTGIVFYEPTQSTQVLGCLELLYSQIGGPLKDVFSEIPEAFQMKQIRIRKIFRNGLEAFVDKKHVLLVGDASFMHRYGLSFPEGNDSPKRATLCISLDKKISAKMSIQYTVEPIFEMLVQRLYQEGIQVVIETFDPLIQVSRIQKIRTVGTAPINVFHKNVSHLYQTSMPTIFDDPLSVVANSSRLKLAEAVVWCKRLRSVRKRNVAWSALYTLFGCIGTVLLLSFGWLSYIHQYWLLLFAVLPHATICLVSFSMMPKKNYFTISACQADLCKHSPKNKKKVKRKKKHE